MLTSNNAVNKPVILTLDKKQMILLADNTQVVTKNNNSVLNNVTIGSQLSLQLAKSGKQPMYFVTLANKQGVSEAQRIDLYKQMLPVQNTPVALLNQLLQLQPHWQTNLSLSEVLKQSAANILALIPAQAQLQLPEGLQKSIQQSGVFLEAKLAEMLLGKMPTDLPADLKLNLLKLAATVSQEMAKQANVTLPHQLKPAQTVADLLNNQLTAVLDKTNASLAKITLDQLHSLPNDDNPKQIWQIELPFLYQGTVASANIEIQQDNSNKGQNKQQKHKNWQVNITLSPPELATIYCRVSCYDNTVNTAFWCKTADTVEKINTHLHYLKQQFEQKGIKTGFMEARQGKPSEQTALTKPNTHLLNEKA